MQYKVRVYFDVNCDDFHSLLLRTFRKQMRTKNTILVQHNNIEIIVKVKHCKCFIYKGDNITHDNIALNPM